MKFNGIKLDAPCQENGSRQDYEVVSHSALLRLCSDDASVECLIVAVVVIVGERRLLIEGVTSLPRRLFRQLPELFQ
jgi:hypothetical protein